MAVGPLRFVYRGVLDRQIVCQIGCLDLLMYPRSPGPVYSREAATFQSVKNPACHFKCSGLCNECVRK